MNDSLILLKENITLAQAQLSLKVFPLLTFLRIFHENTSNQTKMDYECNVFFHRLMSFIKRQETCFII